MFQEKSPNRKISVKPDCLDSVPQYESNFINPRYRSYTLSNFRKINQIQNLPEEMLFEIEVVGTVLPFKANNYVVEQLINWDNVPNDPIFILTFPQKGMLEPHHFDLMANAIRKNLPKKEIQQIANSIRMELNPHPSGQISHNVPVLNGRKLMGMQHKYRETALFFPSRGQTCHAYCTFCFRWPQFIGMDDLKFAAKEIDDIIAYMTQHEEITDLLITGGDPMIMSGKLFAEYIDQLLEARIPNLKTIRIGSKSLAYWPYKFTKDKDSDLVLKAFEKVYKSGLQLSFMAHFNHYAELKTDAVKDAIRRIRETGAQIRTQSPIFAHINDDPVVWEKMWREQTRLGCVPYYMFIPRETGAQHYFRVPLVRAWEIFRKAYMNVSGVSRTVRGPVMSAGPGKIQVLGVSKAGNEDIITLRFIQARNHKWVHKPFFAKYDEDAAWINELEPAFGKEKFFYEDELEDIYTMKQKISEEAL